MNYVARQAGFSTCGFEMLTDAEKNNKIMLLIEQTEAEIRRLHLQHAELHSLLPGGRVPIYMDVIDPKELRRKRCQ